MGKLAVPEYILNKPGRLTETEFEKMKAPRKRWEPTFCRQSISHIRWSQSFAIITKIGTVRGYPDGFQRNRDSNRSTYSVGGRLLRCVDLGPTLSTTPDGCGCNSNPASA